ncbi:MAG: hypothetical protein JNL42_21885, partial [Anaerolineae bacterium]|nr:hypothetical protein [Anaerolineae bacterium]
MTTSRSSWRTWIILTILLVIGVSVAWAQGEIAALEGVSAAVPDGWTWTTSESSGSIYIASDSDALET